MEEYVEEVVIQQECISCGRIAEKCNPRSCKNPDFQDREVIRKLPKLVTTEEEEIIAKIDENERKAIVEEKFRKREEKIARNKVLKRRMNQSEEDDDAEEKADKIQKSENDEIRFQLAHDNVNKIALFKASLEQNSDMNKVDKKKALREYKSNLKEETNIEFAAKLTKSDPIESPKKCIDCGVMYPSKKDHTCETG